MRKRSMTGKVGAKEVFSGRELFVGMDVHKRDYHVAIVNERGQVYKFVTSSDNDAIADTIQSLGDSVRGVAYEAGPTGFSLARALEDRGIPVAVVPPSRVDRPVARAAKTDSLDCEKLARGAMAGVLPKVAVPTKQEQARRNLFRRRMQLVGGVKRAKLRIKSLLLFLGVKEPCGLEGWSNAGIRALEALALDPGDRETMDSHLMELAFYSNQLKAIEKRMDTLMRESLETSYRCLQTVPGVGPTVASGFLLEIFRPERFESADQIGSYLGLAPLVRQSGEHQSDARIAKMGQSTLRSLLVQAAWRWRSKDSGAMALYNRIFSRTGKVQKAIVAVAHKLAVILWRLSVEQRPYRPAMR